MKPIQTLSPYLITAQFHITTIERPELWSTRSESGLRAMPEGTEREAKESQGQNWPGKNLLLNFPMKIKVAPVVFTNH